MSANLSNDARQRFEKLRLLDLENSALLCLSDEFISNLPEKTGKGIFEALMSEYGTKESFLFSDSTTISSDEITQRVMRFMKDGMKFSGYHYRIDSPFDWDGPENPSRNHRYKIHAWIILDEVLQYVEMSNHKEYFYRCRRIAIEWIERYLFGDIQDDFTWYDMSTGQRASLLCFLLRKSIFFASQNKFHSQTSMQQEINSILKLIIAADIHIYELMCDDLIATHSNHGLFQMSGLLSLGSELNFLKQSRKGKEKSVEMIELMLRQHFHHDGFHKEHSPMYHVFMANYLHQLQNAGWLNESEFLLELSIKAKEISNWCIMPDGFLAPIGDSSMYYSSDQLCMFDVNRDSRNRPMSPEGLYSSEKGGVAILSNHNEPNDSPEYLFFNSQFHSRQHKHADDLSFHYCVKGKQYLVDAGTYTYHYDEPERMFIESTRAHNALEIDGLNYSRFAQDFYGSALNFVGKVGDCTIIEGIVDHGRLVSSNIPNNKVKTTDGISMRTHSSLPGVLHKRMLIQVPEGFLAVIDVVVSEKYHEYIQWFHLAPELNLVKNKSKGFVVMDEEGNFHSSIHPINNDNIGEVEAQVMKGQTSPYLQGWTCKDGKQLVPNHALGFKKTGKNAYFVTFFDHSNNKVKRPSVNIGTNGKYVRLVMKYRSEKHDLTIREMKDGAREVTYQIGNKSHSITMPSTRSEE